MGKNFLLGFLIYYTISEVVNNRGVSSGVYIIEVHMNKPTTSKGFSQTRNRKVILDKAAIKIQTWGNQEWLKEQMEVLHKTNYQIGHEVGVSPNSIWKQARAFGIKYPRVRDKLPKKLLKEFCDQGLSSYQIAESFGFAPATIQSLLKEFGLVKCKSYQDKKLLEIKLRRDVIKPYYLLKEMNCTQGTLSMWYTKLGIIPLANDEMWLLKKRCQGWSWVAIGKRLNRHSTWLSAKYSHLRSISPGVDLYSVPKRWLNYQKPKLKRTRYSKQLVFKKFPPVGRWSRFIYKDTLGGLNFSGVYSLFNNKKLIYIGSANNLRHRLAMHRIGDKCTSKIGRDIFKPGLVIAVRPNKIRFEHLMIEARLINRLNPSFNIRLYLTELTNKV